MVAQVVLRLTGPMDHLRLVWQTGETLLESVAFDDDPEGTRYNVLLALQEMVTNVLRHAYAGAQGMPVELTFRVSTEAIEIELRDEGEPFDPLRHDTAGLAVDDAMPVETGGYGIYIARMVMDEVGYRREPGCNVLSLRKLVHRGAGVGNA